MLQHLGQACREARVAAGLRQIDVATSAGTTHATISRFEAGLYWPKDPDAWVKAYADELGVDSLHLWAEAITRWRDAVE
jgi:transcriptional regulator with XRE-family HTH domain